MGKGDEKLINSVRIENFGMHKQIQWRNLQNISLLLGVNGVGKIFILKALVWIDIMYLFKRGKAMSDGKGAY